MTGSRDVPLSVGMLGIGPGGAMILPHVLQHPRFRLAAICDQSPEVVETFAGEGVTGFSSLGAMLDTDLDCIIIATPTHLHAEHAVAALRAGKHVIVEKPVTVTLNEADAIARAAADSGKAVVVGHSQSFEPAIQLMRATIEAGIIGPLRAINGINYTDWMFRPRAADEYDRRAGGGVVFRQGAHHFDILRYIAGGSPRSVRAMVGAWSTERPGDGSYTAFFEFPEQACGSLFYSGYDHFRAVELTYGIDELGRMAGAERKQHSSPASAPTRKLAGSKEQILARFAPGPAPANFGLLIVSCANGDMRICPEGVRIDTREGTHVIALEGLPAGRAALLNELAEAIAGNPVTHDIAWGRANLELSIRLLESSDAHREIALAPDQSTVHTPAVVQAHLAAAITAGALPGALVDNR